MRISTHDYYRTGGESSRDMVFLACWDKSSMYSAPDQDITAGGPIDAPYRIPAGAMDSTSTVDGSGRALPAEISLLRIA